jgi:hypothetical protein
MQVYHGYNDHLCVLVTVSRAFREKAASAQKNDFKLIEHLLRYGQKQKKLLDSPGFKSADFVGPEKS